MICFSCLHLELERALGGRERGKGDKSKKGKIVGQDELEPGVIYVWFTNAAEGWKDPELLQNAIFSAEAVYKDNPFRYLKEKRNKDFHTIVHIVDFGNYKLSDGNHQTCLVALSKSPSSEETALVISFKGSTTKEDWLDNLSLSQEQDNRYVGKFHCGFLKRGNSVNVESFLSYAEHYKAAKIITFGHSLGGVVSSVVHKNLMAQSSDLVKKGNILNFTFVAPLFGNKDLKEYVRKKELSRSMFHFASVFDVVPGILSLGHNIRVLAEEVERKFSTFTGGVSSLATRLLGHNNKLLTCCKAFAEGYFSTLDQGTPLKQLFATHINASKESSLQNEFEENNYVPIGRTVILAKNQGAETLDQGPKIKERILQAAVDQHVRTMSWKEVKDGHVMEAYN